MVALASGRFDPPHVGHVITIQKLAEKYELVKVVILDYPNQYYPVSYRRQIMLDVLGNSKGNFLLVTNKIHFGKITKEQLEEYAFDIYCSGNLQCVKHIESMGYNTEYMGRSYEYAASDDRTYQQIKETFYGT